MATIPATTPILDSDAHARIARLEEQVADILSALHRDQPQKVAVVAKKPAGAAAGRPKKEILPAPPKPEDRDDAPNAADYRLDPSSIKEDVCVGRNLKGNEDKRWAPAVYSESQCGGDLQEGDDLCKTCRTRADKFAEAPASRSDWNGRVTEEPLARCHMLGTAWAASSLPKWKGGPVGGAGTDTASIVSGSDSTASGKMSVAEAKAAAKADKEAAKEAAKAEKEAAKAEKAAKAGSAAGGAAAQRTERAEASREALLDALIAMGEEQEELEKKRHN